MGKANFVKLACGIATLCLMGIATAARAQDAPVKHRKFSLSVGASALTVGENVFGGGSLGIGFAPTPKQLLSLELGGGFGASQNIGTYSYTVSYNDGRSKVLNDGKVTYEYTLAEAMLSWQWLVGLSEKCRFHVGPTAGLLVIDGSDNYSPTTYEGMEIKGMPEPQPVSKSALAGGVIAGFIWNFSQRGFIDLNYRLTANSGLSFPERKMNVLGQSVSIESETLGTIGNRINLSVGWKLGRR